jgi:hypothetical protein
VPALGLDTRSREKKRGSALALSDFAVSEFGLLSDGIAAVMATDGMIPTRPPHTANTSQLGSDVLLPLLGTVPRVNLDKVVKGEFAENSE